MTTTVEPIDYQELDRLLAMPKDHKVTIQDIEPVLKLAWEYLRQLRRESNLDS